MQGYRTSILEIYEHAIETLVKCGIKRDVIDYRMGYKKPRKPTAAFSEFLINRQLGDWTESLFRTEVNKKLEGFKAVKYGAAGRLVVGDPKFNNFFENYHKEIKRIGKRPDLLIFKRKDLEDLKMPDDISEMESSCLQNVAKKAVVAIEVRSSKYYAATYKKVTRKEQSFTPKLEDLPILTHWIVEHEVPCFYTQIFFDEIYIISFEKILQIIKETGNKYIGRMEKNQRKSTFYIPLSEGVCIGQITEDPEWEPKIEKLPDGRVIIYATPHGGKMNLDARALSEYLKLEAF